MMSADVICMGDLYRPDMRGSIYSGDFSRALMALVRAEGELHALGRYRMHTDVEAAIADMAQATTRIVDVGKWAQNHTRGIDWLRRPAA